MGDEDQLHFKSKYSICQRLDPICDPAHRIIYVINNVETQTKWQLEQ